MTDLNLLLRELQPLTEDDRIEARERARALVVRAVGEQPSPEMFTEASMSEYPAWLGRLSVLLMVLVFLAAGAVSFFRLFTAGRDGFLHTINVEYQAVIVGLATFVLAEFLVITSTLLGSIYVEGRLQKALNTLAIVAGLLVAFVGNWHVTRPSAAFMWLETLVPPFAVLATALLGEKMLLRSLKTRQAQKTAYQQALADWKHATADPESSPRWKSVYATVLREKLREVNSSGQGKTRRVEIMASLDRASWRALVYREIDADNWYADDEQPPALPLPALVISANGNQRQDGDFLSAPAEVMTSTPGAN